MTLRNFLLRAYPRSWREEYGEELAAVLAQERLTPGVVADVLGNGARQRLLRDEPWKICGAGLLFRNTADFVAGRSVPYAAFARSYVAGFLLLFLAGAWTFLRERSGVGSAAVAAAAAAFFGHCPDMVLGLLCLPRQRPTPLLTDILFCPLVGFAGTALARVFVSLRKELREA
jgi:hypothetical protein